MTDPIKIDGRHFAMTAAMYLREANKFRDDMGKVAGRHMTPHCDNPKSCGYRAAYIDLMAELTHHQEKAKAHVDDTLRPTVGDH